MEDRADRWLTGTATFGVACSGQQARRAGRCGRPHVVDQCLFPGDQPLTARHVGWRAHATGGGFVPSVCADVAGEPAQLKTSCAERSSQQRLPSASRRQPGNPQAFSSISCLENKPEGCTPQAARVARWLRPQPRRQRCEALRCCIPACAVCLECATTRLLPSHSVACACSQLRLAMLDMKGEMRRAGRSSAARTGASW